MPLLPLGSLIVRQGDAGSIYGVICGGVATVCTIKSGELPPFNECTTFDEMSKTVSFKILTKLPVGATFGENSRLPLLDENIEANKKRLEKIKKKITFFCKRIPDVLWNNNYYCSNNWS